jgi:predicted DsbA family dithiol-disulfide isomerase
MTTVEVVEYTDPWCSWAWGTEPKLRLLRWRYDDRLSWRTVQGDLVADLRNERPDFDPVRAAPRRAGYWREVHEHTGMPWPEHLRWVPMRSEVAGRAVKAAERQGADAGRRMLRALRASCFIDCEPADDRDRVLALAARVEGIDADRLAEDLDSNEVVAAWRADRDETRRPNAYVRNLDETHIGKGNAKPDGDGWRYVFPTLLFRGPGGEHTVPGWQPWERYVDAMEAAVPGSTADPRPDPSLDEAIAAFGPLTECEEAFLCGHAPAPASGAPR